MENMHLERQMSGLICILRYRCQGQGQKHTWADGSHLPGLKSHPPFCVHPERCRPRKGAACDIAMVLWPGFKNNR